MVPFTLGLVHTPVTPFDRDHRVDLATYEKLLDFHVRSGADALALPMHVGESVSLTDAERRTLVEFAIRRLDGRAPVVVHVSDSGTAIAAARARHAERAGAAAVVCAPPYYWTPPPAMLLEHFAQIGSSVSVPFFVYNAPEEMGGTRITAELALRLIERLPNFAGIVDASLDWQFMIEVVSAARKARPGWRLVSATEYLVSACAIGGSGVFAPLAGLAPRLVRRLHDLCREERYREAREKQEALAALRQAVKRGGVAALKAALRAMGRDCGEPRYPLKGLGEAERLRLSERLAAIEALREEPRGW